MGFASTWLHQVSPLLHKTTLTTEYSKLLYFLVHQRIWQENNNNNNNHFPHGGYVFVLVC